MATKMDLKEQLKEKLREIFQFEYEDLDFGIYRIMNYKRKEIEKFIEVDLIKEIENELKVFSEEELSKIKNGLENKKAEIEKTLGKEAFKDGEIKEEYKDTPIVEEYQKLKKQLENVELSEDLEKQVYNHLINFFSRYYDNGDFISKRRYSKNEKYMIPYNGEEVYLYWVNKDQYYIKTTEYFNKYTFYVENIFENFTVNFRIVEAEEEKGNVKSQDNKYFILNEDIFDYDEEKKEINIFFEYRQLTEKEQEKYKKGNSVSQDLINEEILQVLEKKFPKNNIISTLFRKENEEDQNVLLRKHLNKYTRKNTTDYFIHKDLKGFLEKELDFYIKNEYLQMEDLKILGESEYFEKLKVYLISVRVFQNIAMKIIDFLNQIETFQKKVWEKKKFVIDTHYVISLDKIYEYCGEDFFHSILSKILSNKEQIQEWKNLFDIEVASEKDLVENPEKLNFDGEKYKKLPIDTKHFDEEFKWKLLIALTENNDLDEVLDGVLIKSENWQALNLLLNKYNEKVQTIYIDPPFNSPSSEILYKNDYKHSTWLSLMENRLILGKLFLAEEGIAVVAIDENEVRYLMCLMEFVFNEDNRIGTITVRSNPQGRVDKKLSLTSEYNLIYANNINKIHDLGISKVGKWTNLKRTGTNSRREERPLRFYPLLVKNREIFMISDEEYAKLYDQNKKVFDDAFLEKLTEKYKSLGYEILLPVSKNGEYLVWQREFDRVKTEKHTYLVNKGNILTPPLHTKTPQTLWTDSKYSNPEYGTELLKHIINSHKINVSKNTPKSIFTVADFCNLIPSKIVLDFFAGSGTTAHAVMKLNQEDGGKRKFILVEMADYFDTVIVPRIKKVAYTFDWKDGKPQNSNGIGVFFKYHTLEQYEDSLENIEFSDFQPSLYEFEDYFVKYMLDWETKKSKTFLNIDDLQDPFNYKLKIIDNYQSKTVNVDLVETFNYLLGLFVKKYEVIEVHDRKYIFTYGEKDNQNILIVWRSLKDIDLQKDKQIIEKEIEKFSPDKIYINGDAVVKNFEPIEPLFKNLMFEQVI